MPELPEVESVAKTLSLSSCVAGPTLVNFKHSRYQLRSAYPTQEQIDQILGMQLIRVYRRAKYLILVWGQKTDQKQSFSQNKIQEWAMIIHLGMTGSLVFYRKNQRNILDLAAGIMDSSQIIRKKTIILDQIESTISHPHFYCEFSDGSSLIYSDPRRFGLVQLIPVAGIARWEKHKELGVEPLSEEFTGSYLHNGLMRRKNSSIKRSLMDQKLVVGIGNIYTNEALFKARIIPTRASGSLILSEVEALVQASKEIIQLAIAKGGSTIRDYKNNDNQPGEFQNSLAVYGKKGEKCIRFCQGVIVKNMIEGRATYWCESCQK